MKIAKILGVIASLGFAFVVMVPSAKAYALRNRNTSWNSVNKNTGEDRRRSDLLIGSTGSVSNADTITEDTGCNSVNENGGGENEAKTGNATGDVITEDYLNTTRASIDQAVCDDCEDLLENNTTGAGSTNVNTLERRKKADVVQASEGTVTNRTTISLTTGRNSVSRNTGDGNGVDTGNASSTVAHYSDVNYTEIYIQQ